MRNTVSDMASPQGLDTLRTITTPEGVELNLRLAGPMPRACAWAIDLALRAAILVVGRSSNTS